MKLKHKFNKIYQEVACKLVVIVSILVVFLIIRLLIYVDITFTNIVFDNDVSLNSEIPFFISEIIITFLLSYILFAVGAGRNSDKYKEKKEKR
jgi:uncharacterized membrane protein (DUF485 family)